MVAKEESGSQPGLQSSPGASAVPATPTLHTCSHRAQNPAQQTAGITVAPGANGTSVCLSVCLTLKAAQEATGRPLGQGQWFSCKNPSVPLSGPNTDLLGDPG